jgi:L-histidine Nalpha-methyltransferase
MESLSIDTSAIHGDPALMDAIIFEVRKGLTAKKKSLAPWLFYDNVGSALFEKITSLPEYYVSQIERGILRDNVRDILGQALTLKDVPVRIIELGAGSAEKASIILSESLNCSSDVTYVPIDISPSSLELARMTLERDLPAIHVDPIVADYVNSPIQLDPFAGETIVLYIGSSIGNFEPFEARNILRNLYRQLGCAYTLLIGTDLVKPEHVLIPAYDDAQGVTAEFNLNVLRRLNAELQADFLPEAFAHRVVWNEGLNRIEMHLESLRNQAVSIPLANLSLEFVAGETIHTENSYKYTSSSLHELFEDSGLRIRNQWRDRNGWYAVTLAAALRSK